MFRDWSLIGQKHFLKKTKVGVGVVCVKIDSRFFQNKGQAAEQHKSSKNKINTNRNCKDVKKIINSWC